MHEYSRRAACLLVFVSTYVMLDWISYIRPLQNLNLTPWNPAPALGLLLLIRRGRRAVPLLFVAIVASDLIVRRMPGDLATTLLLGMVLTAGYGAIALFLRWSQRDGGLFTERRTLLSWSTIVVAGTLGNGLVFVSALWASGLLADTTWFDALVRFWIGDCVGIIVALPLFWWLQDKGRRAFFRATVLRWETVGYLGLTALTVWIAFVPGASVHFRYFYVLFLPVVWAASRQGLVGAIFCVTVLQLSMILAGLLHQPTEISLLELQIRALLLALVGFLIGVAVDEQRRAAADLRQSLRLAAAAEMTGALAHELNQPLTALSAYGAACQRLLERGAGEAQLRDVIRRMIGEAGRAADVVRRLREFFRSGATILETVPLGEIVEAAAAPFREKAHGTGVVLEVGSIPSVAVTVDRLQIEVVLRNLLANAFEAAAGDSGRPGRVRLASSIEAGNTVAVRVTDNGPGVDASLVERLFEPFASTKPGGLGLGLAVSRAIAEAHGGSLRAEACASGNFRLILPIEPGGQPAHG